MTFKIYNFDELSEMEYFTYTDDFKYEHRKVVYAKSEEPVTGLMFYNYKTTTKNSKYFYFIKDGIQHKLDGPAHYCFKNIKRSIFADKTTWTVYGKPLTDRFYLNFLKLNNIDIGNITHEDEILIRMKFGE